MLDIFLFPQISDVCEDDPSDPPFGNATGSLSPSAAAAGIDPSLYASLTVPVYLPRSQAGSLSNSPRSSMVAANAPPELEEFRQRHLQ